jgi:hypothetical protein
MANFFLTALALAPTAQKDLVDIQRHILEKFRNPSALALLPVLPLFCGKAAPSAAELKAIRGRGLPRFSFAGYCLKGGILCAAARGQAGFYLADWGKEPALPEDLPGLPAYTVKTLRLLVMKAKTAEEPFWWKRIEWEIVSEDWIKLERPPEADAYSTIPSV